MYILKKSENEFYDELVSSSILEFDGIENIRQSLEYFHITKIDGKQFIVYYESNRDIMPTLITENSDGVLAILPLDKTITFLKENQKHFNEIKERV
jgi:hypothetical protein